MPVVPPVMIAVLPSKRLSAGIVVSISLSDMLNQLSLYGEKRGRSWEVDVSELWRGGEGPQLGLKESEYERATHERQTSPIATMQSIRVGAFLYLLALRLHFPSASALVIFRRTVQRVANLSIQQQHHQLPRRRL